MTNTAYRKAVPQAEINRSCFQLRRPKRNIAVIKNMLVDGIKPKGSSASAYKLISSMTGTSVLHRNEMSSLSPLLRLRRRWSRIIRAKPRMAIVVKIKRGYVLTDSIA